MLIIPWKTIDLEIKARLLSYTEVAKQLDMSEKELQELLCGNYEITPFLAEKLEKLFWISKQSWLNLEKFYQRQKLKSKKTKDTLSSLNQSVFFKHIEPAMV